ncbi:MAG: tail fiber domain-containing protein [Candidatus Pacebacteria bacterium]|nr:tail fiber domain-containing protein [Candidatus Paceibacterota bacterium]
MLSKNKGVRGVVLVEILMYTAILGITGAFMGGIFNNVQKFQVKENASKEVRQQLDIVSQTIQRYTRDASSIDIATSTSATTLTLRMQTSAVDPTIIYLANGIIYLKRGSSNAQPLTNNKVYVDKLNFTKVATEYAHDAVQIDLGISYASSTNATAAFTKSLVSIAAKVNAATFDSNLTPGTNSNYDLGIATYKWRNGYFSGNVFVDGNIGIGTTIPGYKFHTYNTAATNNYIEMQSTNSGGASVLQAESDTGWGQMTAYGSAVASTRFGLNKAGMVAMVGSGNVVAYGNNANYPVVFVENALEKMRITGGNLGIGTTTPITKLDLRTSAIGEGIHITADGTTNQSPLFAFYNNSIRTGLLAYILNASHYVDGTAVGDILMGIEPATGDLKFATSDTIRMSVKANGNIGIGTTAPVYGKLEITSTPSNVGGIALYRGTGTTARTWINSDDTWLLQRGVTDTLGLVIKADGSIGMGTTTPTSTLVVNGDIKLLRTGDSSGSTFMRMVVDDVRTTFDGRDTDGYMNYYFNSNASTKVFIEGSTGYVGIGNTDPSYMLTMEASGGGYYNQDTNTWADASSIRWKENVRPLDGALGIINKLQGVRYDWKDSKKEDIGFIAEEVGKILPELVDWDKDNPGYATGFSYGRLTAILTEAVKEQQKQIVNLESRIKALEDLSGQEKLK